MKKKTPAKLKKELWELCKNITREIYRRNDGNFTCFTCGRTIVSNNDAHTSHFIPSATCGAYLRYDLRNLRVCCRYCNIWLGGNGSAFYKNLVAEVGQKEVDKIFVDKNKIIKADIIFYQSKIDEYKERLRNLEKNKRT